MCNPDTQGMIRRDKDRQEDTSVIKEYPILRYEDGRCGKGFDQVLTEFSFSLYLNGTRTGTVCCIPEYLEEMIMGMLCTEGRISSAEDIKEMTVSLAEDRADVVFSERLGKMKRLPDLAVDPQDILLLADRLLSGSSLFDRTGNVHSTMLCRGPEILYFSEDVDRYHALEKTVGRALRDHVDFGKTTLYTTGRIPSTIAEKAVRAGIPAIVSRSAPTDLTIGLAKEYNLTVIGFARKNRMNIYHASGYCF